MAHGNGKCLLRLVSMGCGLWIEFVVFCGKSFFYLSLSRFHLQLVARDCTQYLGILVTSPSHANFPGTAACAERLEPFSRKTGCCTAPVTHIGRQSSK